MASLYSVATLGLESLSSVGMGLSTLSGRAVGDGAANTSDVDQRMVLAWIIMQLAGQIALPILVATMVFHRRVARRNPTIINLCIVWTFATIPPLLLFYAGKYKGSQPSVMLCLFQAATISGIPPMAAVAYLAVVVHACTVVYELKRDITVRPFTLNLRMIILLASPYLVFLVFAIYVAFFGTTHSNDIFRDEFFCVVGAHNLSVPVFIFTTCMIVFTLIAQAWIMFTCYRDYRSKDSRSSGSSFRRRLSNFDMQFVLRMLGFTVFEIVIAVACIASTLNPSLSFAKLLLATPPFAVFLVFATSQDILCAWLPCCFRRDSTALVRSKSVLQVSRSERSAMARAKNPSPGSSFSVYSQSSQTPILAGTRGIGGDLEKGIQRPPEIHGHLSRDYTVESVETSMMVQPGSQLNPLDTIRSLRTPRKPIPF